MDGRIIRLLEILKDGKWHQRVCRGNIGVGTVEACAHLGFIRKKFIVINPSRPVEERRWRGSFKITRKGRCVLKTGNGPSREEFARAIHFTTCTTPFCGKHSFA